ncbi:MAG: hypothetical protein ACREQV_25140 [Candidatus Binatia bacterium]
MIRYSISAAVSAFICLMVSGVCIGEEKLDLSLRLEVVSDSIGPIEPLSFQLTIMNNGAEDLVNLAPWAFAGSTEVEFRKPDSEEWEALSIPYFYRFATKDSEGSGYEPLALSAGESKTSTLVVLGDNVVAYPAPRFEYYFNTAGQYLLRAEYKPREGHIIRSKEVRFRVVQYDGSDAEAYEWLKTREIPHFMYDPLFAPAGGGLVFEEELRDDARTLIEQFRSSRFAPWAKFFLAKGYAIAPYLQEEDRGKTPAIGNPEDVFRELSDAEDPRLRELARETLKEIEEQRRREATLLENEERWRKAHERAKQLRNQNAPLASNEEPGADASEESTEPVAASASAWPRWAWWKYAAGVVAALSVGGLIYVAVRYRAFNRPKPQS